MRRCAACGIEVEDEARFCPVDGSRLDPADTVTHVGPAPLSPGTMAGEYRLGALIGHGGMGVVYAAEHPLIGKRAAVKVLLSRDETMVQRFIQEARAVNTIRHPNIVDIFGFGSLPSGQHYYVMEFLDGSSLRERMNQPAGRPSLDEARAILGDVCVALAAAHAEGIVHRDLKPENVFLAETKRGVTVKLLDFGIAKLAPEEALARTSTGAWMGTPHYMSPEQCQGRPVDARTDIYSLGVLLFELATGKLPFEGGSWFEVASAHITKEPPRPSSLAPLPPSLEALVLRCLEKDPARRPRDVDEVRAGLAAPDDAVAGDGARLTASARREILERLSRVRLAEIAARWEVTVADRRVRGEYVKAIVRSRRVGFAELLRGLKRDELKAICEALQIDASGREKDALVRRILDR